MLWVQLVWTTGISESSIAYTGVIPTWKFTCELWHGRWKLAIHVLCELPLNDCWWGENRGLTTLGTHMKSSSFIYINMYNMLPRQHNKNVACISLQHGCYLGSKQAVPIPHIHTLVPTCSRRKSLGTKATPSTQWNYLQMVFMGRGFSFGG